MSENLIEQLRLVADGDLREYARDSLIGIHPEQDELRMWADLMAEAAGEIEHLRAALAHTTPPNAR
jgi:hypothetical protein